MCFYNSQNKMQPYPRNAPLYKCNRDLDIHCTHDRLSPSAHVMAAMDLVLYLGNILYTYNPDLKGIANSVL